MAFWGALAKAMADHNVSTIFTPDEWNTAMFLHSLAKKLQREEKKDSCEAQTQNVYAEAKATVGGAELTKNRP